MSWKQVLIINYTDELFYRSPLSNSPSFENYCNLSWEVISHSHVLEFTLLIWSKDRLVVSWPIERLLWYSRQKMVGVWYRAVPFGVQEEGRYMWKILRWRSFVWTGYTSSSKTKTWLLEWKTTERSRGFCLLSPDTHCQWAAPPWWNEGSLWEIEDHVGVTSFFQGFQKSHSY